MHLVMGMAVDRAMDMDIYESGKGSVPYTVDMRKNASGNGDGYGQGYGHGYL
jgi:hypothetical protein